MSKKKLGKIVKEAQKLATSSYMPDLEESVELYLEVADRYEEKGEMDQSKIYAIKAISICMEIDKQIRTHYWPLQAVKIARDYDLKESFVRNGLELVERYQNIGWMQKAEALMREIKPLIHLIPEMNEQIESHIKMYEAELRKTHEDDLVKMGHIYWELGNLCKMAGNENKASDYLSTLRDLIDICDAQTEPSRVLKPGDSGFDEIMRIIKR